MFTTGNGYGTTESTVWELDGNGDGTFQMPRQILSLIHICPQRRLTLRILFIALLILRLGSAQVLQPHGSGIAQTQRGRLIRKQAIERHFESIEPRPLRQFDGAVPGSALLAQHREAAAKVETRVRASLAARPQATSQSNALSGILFRPAIPAGVLPTSVVTGDFNRDGKMDFIVANALTNDLWLYPGNGDGTFQLPKIIPLSKGLSPVGLATASLRNTGILDLVVAESDSSTIGVLLGNGDGTFGYETESVSYTHLDVYKRQFEH